MNKRWLICCLAFWIALLCAIAIPSFARLPAAAPVHLTSRPDVNLLEQQAKAYYETGRLAEAATALQQASQLYQTDNPLRQAIVLSNLALTEQQIGSLASIASANRAIQESLALLDGLPSTTARLSAEAQILDVQGRLQLTQGQAEAALSSWQQAAQLYQQLKDDSGLTRSQIDQARALQALGFYQRSIELLIQVLALPAQVTLSPGQPHDPEQSTVSLAELLGLSPPVLEQEDLNKQLCDLVAKLPASVTTAVALQNLGEALRISGGLEQAEILLQRGLSIVEPQHPDIAAAILLDLGNTARAKKDRPQQDTVQPTAADAFGYYEQAIQAGGSIGIRAQINSLSLHIVQAQQAEAKRQTAQKNWVKAQQLVPQIQQQIDKLPVSQTTVYARINFAQSQVKLLANDPAAPIQIAEIEALLAKTQQQAEQLQDARAISYAMGTRGHLYEVLKRWPEADTYTRQALQSSQPLVNLPKQGFSTAPDVRYLWQWQLGRILKAEAEQMDKQNHDSQKQYEEATAAYAEAIKILQSLQIDLVIANQNEQFNFRNSIEPAYREYIQLLLRADPATASPTRLPQTNIDQTSLKTARQSLQSLQSAELQNFLREACVNIPFVDLDKTVVEASQKAVAANDQKPQTALLYPIILPDRVSVILKLPQSDQLLYYATKVEQDTVKTTLATLRAQITQPVPFDFTEAHRLYNWLIAPAIEALQQNNIKTLVFVLDGALQQIPMAVLHDGSKFLIQNYSIALAPGLEIPDPKPLPRQELRLLLAGISESVTIGQNSFQNLASAEKQIDEIKRDSEAQGYAVETLFNQDFIAKNLRTKIQNLPFQIVHLLTHGEFSSERNETYILSSNRKIKVTELSQILRTREQSNPIELLVLSACQTAQDDRAELGMAGVAVQSGARSTVASLWSIYDNAAEIFMPEFYRQLTTSDVTKAEALRQAQLKLLENPNPKFAYPVNWAPFVLLGNWL